MIKKLTDGKFKAIGSHWIGEPTFKKITKLTLLVNHDVVERYIERRRIPIADGFFDAETLDGQKLQINTKYIVMAEEYTLVQRVVAYENQTILYEALVLDNQKVAFELIPSLNID